VHQILRHLVHDAGRRVGREFGAQQAAERRGGDDDQLFALLASVLLSLVRSLSRISRPRSAAVVLTCDGARLPEALIRSARPSLENQVVEVSRRVRHSRDFDGVCLGVEVVKIARPGRDDDADVTHYLPAGPDFKCSRALQFVNVQA
jgi:hypothetical protein